METWRKPTQRGLYNRRKEVSRGQSSFNHKFGKEVRDVPSNKHLQFVGIVLLLYTSVHALIVPCISLCLFHLQQHAVLYVYQSFNKFMISFDPQVPTHSGFRHFTLGCFDTTELSESKKTSTDLDRKTLSPPRPGRWTFSPGVWVMGIAALPERSHGSRDDQRKAPRVEGLVDSIFRNWLTPQNQNLESVCFFLVGASETNQSKLEDRRSELQGLKVSDYSVVGWQDGFRVIPECL